MEMERKDTGNLLMKSERVELRLKNVGMNVGNEKQSEAVK